MSITAAATFLVESIILMGCLAVAMVMFFLVRAHEADTIRGPVRVDAAEPMGLLPGVTIAGFAGWMLASMAALTLFRGPTTQGATNPAAIPSLAIIWTGVIGQLIGLVVLVGANLIFRPGGLGRLGLSLPSLRTGVRAGLIGVCFVIPAMLCVSFSTEAFWRMIRIEHPAKHELLTAMDQPGSLHLRIMAIISAVVIAPVFEEILFRGHIQTILRRAFTEKSEPDGRIFIHDTPTRIWLGICFASVAFMLVHPAWTYPPIFFLALCLGYVYERTGSLWAPILIHAAFNAIQTIFSLAMG